jgi:hypothetical protein
VVWAPEIPERGAVEGNLDELGHRFFRILLSSTGEPHRVLRIQSRAAEDDLGDYYLVDFSGIFDFLSGDRFKWNYGVGFALIVAAAFFIFHKW